MNNFDFLKMPVGSTVGDCDPEACFSYIWFYAFMIIGSTPYGVLTELGPFEVTVLGIFAVVYLVCSKVKATECASSYSTIWFSSSLGHA